MDLTTFDGFQGYENITSFEIHYAPEFKSTLKPLFEIKLNEICIQHH